MYSNSIHFNKKNIFPSYEIATCFNPIGFHQTGKISKNGWLYNNIQRYACDCICKLMRTYEEHFVCFTGIMLNFKLSPCSVCCMLSFG